MSGFSCSATQPARRVTAAYLAVAGRVCHVEVIAHVHHGQGEMQSPDQVVNLQLWHSTHAERQSHRLASALAPVLTVYITKPALCCDTPRPVLEDAT